MMRVRNRGTLGIVGALAAYLVLWNSSCSGTDASARHAASGEPRSPRESAPAQPSAGTRVAAIDPRDQYTLLAGIEAAQCGEPDTQDERFDAVRRDWLGKRVRWEVLRVPILCESEALCAVLPFDQAKRREPIVQGWMPALHFAPGQLTRMKHACDAVAGAPCVVQVEGTVSSFELSTAMPTSLALSGVTFVTARAASPDDRWNGIGPAHR